MTPSIQRSGMHGPQMISSKSKGKYSEDQQYPGSSGMHKNQMMVQDGGTGASLKRMFIQQESIQSSQADSQSNYGTNQIGTGYEKHHNFTSHVPSQSYHLPLKQVNSQSVSQQKRLQQIQKANNNGINRQVVSNTSSQSL